MSPSTMAALRITATVAHALPGVGARLRHGDRLLVEVTSTPTPGHPTITPCLFRRAVAQAHEAVKAGRPLTFIGLPEGDEPAIDVRVATGDRVWPAGLYRVRCGESDLHAFATTLSWRACQDVLARQSTSVRRHPSATAGAAVQLHHDVATEVTLVSIRTPRQPKSLDAHPLLEDLLVGCGTEEIVNEMQRSFRR